MLYSPCASCRPRPGASAAGTPPSTTHPLWPQLLKDETALLSPALLTCNTRTAISPDIDSFMIFLK